LKHPDKNPDDPLAVTEFIKITKAYTVWFAFILYRSLDIDRCYC
jgi:curved DNA-binding protein CbpA